MLWTPFARVDVVVMVQAPADVAMPVPTAVGPS